MDGIALASTLSFLLMCLLLWLTVMIKQKIDRLYFTRDNTTDPRFSLLDHYRPTLPNSKQIPAYDKSRDELYAVDQLSFLGLWTRSDASRQLDNTFGDISRKRAFFDDQRLIVD